MKVQGKLRNSRNNGGIVNTCVVLPLCMSKSPTETLIFSSHLRVLEKKVEDGFINQPVKTFAKH